MKKKLLLVGIAIFAVLLATACTKKEEKKEESKMNYLILVNKQNKLPDDWEEIVELTDVTNGLGETYKVEKKAAEAYEKLREDLSKEGIIIELDSTYRTVKQQEELWQEFLKEYGEEYTKTYVAVPGTSEHHTGLAIDVKLNKNGEIIDDNDAMTAET